jgi:hypothetical protein
VYLKERINELETNNNNKNIRVKSRGINEFKRGFQSRTNLVKYENGNLLAYTHNVLNKWKNYFCHLLYVHGT